MKKFITFTLSVFILFAMVGTNEAQAASTTPSCSTKQTVKFTWQGLKHWKWGKNYTISKPTTPIKDPVVVTPPKQTTPPAPATPIKDTPAVTVEAFEQQVIDLTNVERAKEGLPALKAHDGLMATAEAKSADMSKNKYFSHTSPTLGSPFDQMKAKGITYRSAGENIAMGQKTAAEVVKAWMESPGHRANILNKNYTHIGVGYISTGNYWTQQFIGQ